MRDPDKRGPATAAWHSRPSDPDVPNLAAHVDAWVIQGPFHPHWSYWMVGAVDLAEHPGVDPPHKNYPGAEFEIMVVSLDPKCYPPDPDAPAGLAFLTPPDLVFQFDGISREQVAEILGLMVDQIVGGRSCDSDFRGSWEQSLATTVEHYKTGRH